MVWQWRQIIATILDCLCHVMPHIPREQWLAVCEEGRIVTDDQVIVPAHQIVRAGERYLHLKPAQREPDVNADIRVLFEDEAVIVLNKPAGLVVHPAAGNWTGTLLNGLLHHFPPIVGVPRAGIVHRLDKDTSGLMVVAKTLESHTDLVRQLQDRTVSREYMALVWGAPRLRSRIEAAIGRHPRDRLKMAVLESETAKPAVTHYERIATGTLDRHRVSLVRCRLETGRTHQIRVHMLSIGFPLVGDTSYGKQHLAHFFPRQALHACHLGLIHPHTGEECAWDAPLPEDFAALLELAGIKDFEQK